MYIEKMSINSFRTLQNTEIVLSDGLNIIEGENESGKSTLMAFVIFVLYGTDASLSKRMRLTGESFSGSLTLMCEKLGKITVLRIASAAGTKISEEVNITSCETLKEISIGKTSPGEYILGVNRDFFESSAFIVQKGASEYDSSAVSSAVQNILNSANEKMSTDKGRKKLDETRKCLKYKNNKGGAIYTVSCELSELEYELEKCKTNRDELERDRIYVDELRAQEIELDKLPKIISDEKKARGAKKYAELSKSLDLLNKDAEVTMQKYGEVHTLAESFRKDESAIRLRRSEVEAKAIHSKIEVLNQTSESDENRLASMSRVQNPIPDNVDEYTSLVQNMRYSVKKWLYFAIFAFIFSALMIILGIICVVFDEIIAAVAFVCSTLTVSVIGFVFLSNRRNKSEELRRFLADYLLDTDITLRGIKDEFERRADFEKMKAAKVKDIADIRNRTANEEKAYSAAVEEINRLMLRIISHLPDVSLEERITICEEKIRNTFEEESRLQKEYERILAEKKRVESEINVCKLYSGFPISINERFSNYSDAALDEYLQNSIKRKNAISDEIREMSVRISSLESSMRPEIEIELEIQEKKKLLETREEQFDIVTLAQEALESASQNIRSAVTPNLIAVGDRLFAEMTSGKYEHIGIASDMSVNGISGKIAKSESELSYGTNEAMYLAFRLSLCTVLCKNEMPPLMFDETFAHIDDKRLSSVMKILSEINAQTVIFTCTCRESQIADTCGFTGNVVKI